MSWGRPESAEDIHLLMLIAVYWRATKETQLWFVWVVEQDCTYSSSITCDNWALRWLHPDWRKPSEVFLHHRSHCKPLSELRYRCSIEDDVFVVRGIFLYYFSGCFENFQVIVLVLFLFILDSALWMLFGLSLVRSLHQQDTSYSLCGYAFTFFFIFFLSMFCLVL